VPGAKPTPDAEINERVDDSVIVPVVEVVDELRPLVSDIPMGLEAEQSPHARER
jgi:hypothetical protein